MNCYEQEWTPQCQLGPLPLNPAIFPPCSHLLPHIRNDRTVSVNGFPNQVTVKLQHNLLFIYLNLIGDLTYLDIKIPSPGSSFQ
jgi:hypothetical protein